MRIRRSLSCLTVVALLVCAHPLTARACAICYGEPDSPVSNGLTWAITALAAIVMSVLAGVVAFFMFMNRRAVAQAETGVSRGADLAVQTSHS